MAHYNLAMTYQSSVIAWLRWYQSFGLHSIVAAVPSPSPDNDVTVSNAPAAAPATLAELAQAMQAVPTSLKTGAKKFVFADGNPQAPLMLIGEAPGVDEDRIGKPFVGVSGQLLDKMLAAIGLDRRGVYITNILPWRPPQNRSPSVEEIALFLPYVQQHIALVNPRLLVCVGGTAAKALLGTNEGILKLRGRQLALPTDPGRQVFATLHPAYLLRNPISKREAWQDWQRIQQILAGRDA